MDQVLVWYERGQLTGSAHLTILQNSVIYTIAEFESRNTDTKITHYQDKYWNVIYIGDMRW